MGVSVAFVMAVDVIAQTIGQTPLPPGLNTAEAGDWVLTVNNSREPATFGGQELQPWDMFAENKRYLAFGIFNPVGGMIGGMSEDQFIADMKALGAKVPDET